MNNGKYYIIYPKGDRDKLYVIGLSNSCYYELGDYAVASKESFYEKSEAIKYAKKLAKENSLLYVCGDNEYLD